MTMIFARNESAKHPEELRGAFLALLKRDFQEQALEGMDYVAEDGQIDLCLFRTEENQKRLDHWHRVFRGIMQKPAATVPFDLRHVPEDFILFLQRLRKKNLAGGQQRVPTKEPKKPRGDKADQPSPPQPEESKGEEGKEAGENGQSAA